jgi:hypothetical protein
MHVEEPDAAENVPGAHAVHAAADGAVAPGVPAAYVPAAHGVPEQTEAPLEDECVPTGQSVHVAPACDVARVGPNEPGAHRVPAHTVEPVVVLYVPGAHAVHAGAPRELEPTAP